MSADLLSTLFTLFSEKTNCSWLGWRERREKKEGGLPRSRTRCSLATRGTGQLSRGCGKVRGSYVKHPVRIRKKYWEDVRGLLGVLGA